MSNTSEQTSVCPICEEKHAQLESHHVHPIQYGGDPNGLQVLLCSSCHQKIHYQAEALTAKNPSRKSYFSALELERARTLIRAIVQSKLVFSKTENPNNPRKIVIEIPQYLLTRLHKVKQDKGFSNLQKYIVSLLTDHVNKNL